MAKNKNDKVDSTSVETKLDSTMGETMIDTNADMQSNSDSITSEMEEKVENSKVVGLSWKMISYVLFAIIILMIVSAGGYYWYHHRNGVLGTQTSTFVDDSASNALLNIGKDASVKNYNEALARISIDDVVKSISDSDVMWKSELVRQGQTDPKPEDVQKFKDYIKNTPAVYAQLTTSIKMSFLDAIQGDEDANVDLLALVNDLKNGKLPDSFKQADGEATFEIPNRKEVWHLKNMDGGWKVYKIDITG